MRTNKIKLFAIIFFALPLLLLAIFKTTPAKVAGFNTDDPAVTYKAKCAMCHTPTASKFFDPAKTDQEHVQTILKGKKGEKPPYMPAWETKGITEDDAKALAAYMRQLKMPSNANANTNTNTTVNANANTNVNASANANTNVSANVNANTNVNASANANTNVNANVNANTNVNANVNTNTNVKANVDANANSTAITDVATTYKTKCAACHSPKGEKFFDTAKTDEALVEIILKGKKGEKPPFMPGFEAKGMTAEEAKGLVTYLRSLRAPAN